MLLILVINAPQNAAPEALQRTQDLYNQITAAGYAYVIVVDRVSAPWRLNPKQGVGLARKIGTDLALALIEQGRIHSPWILQTDADVYTIGWQKRGGVAAAAVLVECLKKSLPGVRQSKCVRRGNTTRDIGVTRNITTAFASIRHPLY